MFLATAGVSRTILEQSSKLHNTIGAVISIYLRMISAFVGPVWMRVAADRAQWRELEEALRHTEQGDIFFYKVNCPGLNIV